MSDLPARGPGPGEIRLRVHASGVNFPDTLVIEGKYQVQSPIPFVPGFEVAGEVIEIGGNVSGFKPGDRIMALTRDGHGGFAEEAVVPFLQSAAMPSGTDYVAAADFYSSYGTAFHALVQRAKLQEAETLVVLGASGALGIAAIEIGKVLGARVIAVASSADKLRVAAEHGADELVDYNREPLKVALSKLTASKGVDVGVDSAGVMHSTLLRESWLTTAACSSWVLQAVGSLLFQRTWPRSKATPLSASIGTTS